MQTSTTLARWVLVAVVVFGVTSSASAQRTVTLKLNTATLPDTIDALDEIQIRGQLGSGTALPGGGVIDWGNSTTLKPTNVGGDYWNIQFQIPNNDQIQYKFYAQRAESDGIGGWEDGDNHVIPAGTGAVDRGLHYFVKGDGRAYNWSPFDKIDRPASTVGVHFRVYMCSDNGKGEGYDKNFTGLKIGVRGGTDQGVLDWGNTNVELRAESAEKGKPGYHLYSGVAYYPNAKKGTTQMYKFVNHKAAGIGWEGGALTSDRSFKVPTKDSTLHWVYYGNTRPASCDLPPQLATVIFSVDLAPLQDVGLFNKSRGDTLQVRGGFNGWGCGNPDTCLLLPFPGTSVYEAAVTLEAFPETEYKYKYYIDFNNENFVAEFGAQPPNGWEEPLNTTGADRGFFFKGDPGRDQYLGYDTNGDGNPDADTRFNDVFEGNIMLAGERTAVTFSVDMNPAKTMADPFNPAVHNVYVDLTGDGVWAFLQGIPRTNDGVGFKIDDTFTLTDPDGDGVFKGTLMVEGPNYAALQYKYAYGSPGSYISESGGSTAQVGRRRLRYIQPRADGSWPATFRIAQERFNTAGVIPESQRDLCNPGAVVGCIVNVASERGGELPTQVTLSQNFPNPFNPTTSLEYTIDRTTDVRLQVVDLLGRVVATLVDAKQQANTYRVSFDASKLASGTYIYRLETPHQVINKTMVLVK